MENTAPVSNAPSTQAPQPGSNPSSQNPAKGGEGSSVKDITQAAEGKSQAQAQPEFFDIKVNGKTVKMTRQEVMDYASMSHAANSKFDEASKLRKSVDKIISTAKTNPIEALMDPTLGLTKDQIRDAFEQWYHREYIEAEKLTPEQKQLKKYEAELKAYKDAEAEKTRKAQEDEQTDLTNKQRSYLETQIIEAIEKSGLPKSKWLAGRMAFYMRQNLTKGWDAPQDMIIRQVKQERQAIMSDLTDSSDGDTLINLLGEGVVNKIRQYDLKRLRDQRSSKAPEFKNQNTPQGDGYGNKGKVSYSDVTKRLQEMRTGKKLF
jgi:hypothetical protein